MFLMYLPMGMWLPSLANILKAYDARWAVAFAFVLIQVMGVFSSLLFATLSDRKIEAQKLLGYLSFIGGGFLWLAFSTLVWGWHPSWYLLLQCCWALASAPMIPLIAKVKLANLSNPEKSFPLYSVCGTIGWLSGGLIVSGLGLDISANTGRIAAYVQVLLGFVCFLLPATLPEDKISRGWKAALGLQAFSLIKNRELRVLYIASMLIAVPYVSFFMLVPEMLITFGSKHPAAQMTIGQVTEIFAMLSLSILAGRYRIRFLMIVSMLLGFSRFVFFALSGATGLLPMIWLGISLHGPIYVFMTISGRIFIDRSVSLGVRGQAQALHSLLTINLAGILGSLFCELVYRRTVLKSPEGWTVLWAAMAVFTLIPLIYFFFGAFRDQFNPAKPEPTSNFELPTSNFELPTSNIE